jgi:hypothetical protein
MSLSKNNFQILLALLSLFCVAYMDVGQGREQGAVAFQQELHNPATRPLLRLENKQHCCAISVSYLWTTPMLTEIDRFSFNEIDCSL